MLRLCHANTLLMPHQVGNQIFRMKWRFQPFRLSRFGKVRRERVGETKKDIRKGKKKKTPEVPGKMRKHHPTRFHYGQVIYFYHPLQSFNKMVVHWIWIHVNSWHQLCITFLEHSNLIFSDFFPSMHISLPHQKNLLFYSLWQHMHFSFWLMCRICTLTCT